MALRDAPQKAAQILDEERAHPTVSYWAEPAYQVLEAFNKGKHPRPLQENPQTFQLRSANFDLLCLLLDQTPESGRHDLFEACLSRLINPAAYRHLYKEVQGAGQSSRCSSELPLTLEFAVRRGNKEEFICTLHKAALSPGLSLLLLHLEEMIALNFMLFTDEEYTQIPIAIEKVKRNLAEFRKTPHPTATLVSNVKYYVLKEVPPLCDSVSEMCRKARYLYSQGFPDDGNEP